MPNLTRLVQNRAPAQIDFGEGNVLHVEFYPARLTTAMLLDLADAGKLADLPQDRALSVMTSVSDILLALLASWDLTETAADGSEQPLAISAATLATLGVNLQWTILNGILGAQSAEQQGKAAAPQA